MVGDVEALLAASGAIHTTADVVIVAVLRADVPVALERLENLRPQPQRVDPADLAVVEAHTVFVADDAVGSDSDAVRARVQGGGSRRVLRRVPIKRG